MKKTKNNWWIIIIAFIMGLLIGGFFIGGVFEKKTSLAPEDAGIEFNCISEESACSFSSECCSKSCINEVCSSEVPEKETTAYGSKVNMGCRPPLLCPGTITHYNDLGEITSNYCLREGITRELGCNTRNCYYQLCNLAFGEDTTKDILYDDSGIEVNMPTEDAGGTYFGNLLEKLFSK